MNNTDTINGNPTKKFFIEMITRDISIEDAVVDLLDNSIDGANRLNPNDFSNRRIDIEMNQNHVIIKDNCGGFPLGTAKDYAFRFGRPDGAPVEKNTVGRFGIGMKRSLFKMGKKFVVESQNNNDHFKVECDVEQWNLKTKTVESGDGEKQVIDDWNFDYSILTERMELDGTKIEITEIHDDVKELIIKDSFLNTLRISIQKSLSFYLMKGLSISLNEEKLIATPCGLLLSEDVKPFYKKGNVDGVDYMIIAGLGKTGMPKESGWYIYCNNRLVVDADTSSLTGWGTESVKKWHPENVMFRGILFFDSEETIKLPLTTTKKGIDSSSIIYQKILPYMTNAMVQINKFLNNITKLKDDATEYREKLSETLTYEDAVSLKVHDFSLQNESRFYPPTIDIDAISEKSNTVRIAYDVDKLLATNAKEHAELSSFKDLGKYSFDYYVYAENIQK